MNKPRGETDLCRHRLLKYCKGQGLDLGCGNVKIKAEAIGIDFFSPYADMNMDVRLMPYYENEQFDYVYSSHLLEEIENTEAVLKEWLRIIKPGGYLILYQADKEYYYSLDDPRCNPSHKHHFSLEILKELLLKTEQLEIIHEGRYDPEKYKEWSFEIVAQKKGGIEQEAPSDTISFKIMVVGGYAEQYIEKCLNSLVIQDYSNWIAQVVLDPVDNSYQNALKFQNEKIKIIQNEKQLFNIANFLKAVSLLKPADDDVLVMIDGDDWLANSSVLSILKIYYEQQSDLLLTHGSWEPYPNPNATNNIAYSEDDFEKGVRNVRWRGSHLRTCKYKLWKYLRDDSLRNGNYYYTTAGDLAIMFPLLEMAGYKRIKFISEILYIYNQETAFNDEKKKLWEQKEAEIKIRKMKPYKILEEEIKNRINCFVYSKNRACQLDAFLRSLKFHWSDWKDTAKVSVIWCSDNEKYTAAYEKLFSEHTDINFINQNEKDFKQSLINEIDPAIPYTIQFVDDIIFINPFSINCATFESFKNDSETMCLSLRMYPGISYCYMKDIETNPPEFTELGKWAWSNLKGDWSYPASVDGHIFRTDDIISCISNENYNHPNALEEKMVQTIAKRPFMRCFQEAKIINIPSNLVCHNVSNRHGNISIDFLNDQYLNGLKIDIKPFIGLKTNSVHYEMDYQWE